MVILDAELPCVVRYVKTADGGTDPTFDYVPTQPCNSSQWQYRCGIRSRGSDATVLGGKLPSSFFLVLLFVWGEGVLPLVLSLGGKLKDDPTV